MQRHCQMRWHFTIDATANRVNSNFVHIYVLNKNEEWNGMEWNETDVYLLGLGQIKQLNSHTGFNWGFSSRCIR